MPLETVGDAPVGLALRGGCRGWWASCIEKTWAGTSGTRSLQDTRSLQGKCVWGEVYSPVLSNPEHLPEGLTPNALTFGSPRISKGLHIHRIALSIPELCEKNWGIWCIRVLTGIAGITSVFRQLLIGSQKSSSVRNWRSLRVFNPTWRISVSIWLDVMASAMWRRRKSWTAWASAPARKAFSFGTLSFMPLCSKYRPQVDQFPRYQSLRLLSVLTGTTTGQLGWYCSFTPYTQEVTSQSSSAKYSTISYF